MDKATRWGDLESEEEESEEEEEEEEDEDEDTESLADGITSIASGYNSSLPSGIETPEVIDLRKGKPGARSPASLCHLFTLPCACPKYSLSLLGAFWLFKVASAIGCSQSVSGATSHEPMQACS